MNEQQFSLQIRHALDASAEKLPYRVTHRLGYARELALARMQAAPAVAGLAQLAGTTPSAVPITTEVSAPGRFWRIAGTLVPVLIVVMGLIAMNLWDIADKADELAEIDAAVLTDDVPIDVYADRGFGVFIKNSRQ